MAAPARQARSTPFRHKKNHPAGLLHDRHGMRTGRCCCFVCLSNTSAVNRFWVAQRAGLNRASRARPSRVFCCPSMHMSKDTGTTANSSRPQPTAGLVRRVDTTLMPSSSCINAAIASAVVRRPFIMSWRTATRLTPPVLVKRTALK